jgi:hypothetical protein
MNLVYYHGRFNDALTAKYKDTFAGGFSRIKALYKEVKKGDRLLEATDVIAIFEKDLPFHLDWTKPDRKDLEEAMKKTKVAGWIKSLGGREPTPQLIQEIWRCFRELSLTALVLHHVYPERFAICSHHLASLLNISAPRVPDYYIEYCDELKCWSEGEWPRGTVVDEVKRSRPNLTVAEAEFALWTWYRFAYIDGPKKQKKQHWKNFHEDPWVRERRAVRIAKSLGPIKKLELAESYLCTEPTVAAMIAWRELESEVRKMLNDFDRKPFGCLIEKLPASAFSRNLPKHDVELLWNRRNDVMHRAEDIAEDKGIAKKDSARVLHGVVDFIEKNRAPHSIE